MSYEFIKSAGIDYVTLTSTHNGAKSAYKKYFMDVANRDRQLGYKTVAGGAYGFYGQRTRHALLAEREDRAMLQVSGYEAQRTDSLMKHEGHCTRLDIQVTVQCEEGEVPQILEYLYNASKTHPLARGHQPTLKRIEGQGGTETVYIGSRKSDVFIRLYDKGLESGEEEYKNCVRLEVELKGKVANSVWIHCKDEGVGTRYLLQVLKHTLETRGVDVDWFTFPVDGRKPPHKEKTRDEVTMYWWEHQVAPSIKRIVGEWGWQTPMRILFGKALTDHAWTAILNAWSLGYGN